MLAYCRKFHTNALQHIVAKPSRLKFQHISVATKPYSVCVQSGSEHTCTRYVSYIYLTSIYTDSIQGMSFNTSAPYPKLCTACTKLVWDNLALAFQDDPSMEDTVRFMDFLCLNLENKWCYLEWVLDTRFICTCTHKHRYTCMDIEIGTYMCMYAYMHVCR